MTAVYEVHIVLVLLHTDHDGDFICFFFSSRRRHTRYWRDWSSDVCSSDLSLGFETTYFADTYKPAVEWVSETAPRGATVYAQAGTHPVLESYRRIGELRRDLRPAYLAPIAPEGPVRDQEPREDSYFLFLPRQSIYTDQMLALEKKGPLYEHRKGGVPLVRVYSGKAVEETLAIDGGPEPRDVGLANALMVCGGVLAMPYLLRRRKMSRPAP